MRLLVVSPHADDEVLGCGGLIARAVKDGASVDIAIATLGGNPGRSFDQSGEGRKRELLEAAEILGANEPCILFPGHDGRLDTIPVIDIISRLDALLDERRYDEVYFCYPSHHQDHKRVYEACLGSLRPKGRHEPSLLALYEYPFVGWSPYVCEGARLYIDITNVIAKKEAALRAYASELRAPPHPVSWDASEALARMRGIECGRKYAELFYVQRVIR